MVFLDVANDPCLTYIPKAAMMQVCPNPCPPVDSVFIMCATYTSWIR